MSFAHWSILAALGTAFGASFGFNEILLTAYGPLTVSAVRVTLGAIGCWVWVAATGRRVDLGDAGLIAIGSFGIMQYAAPFALLPLAQQHVSSSSAGIANALTPVAVVVISHLWPSGERATTTKMVGVGLGLLGMIVMTAQGQPESVSERPWLLVAVLAPVCYGIALNLARSLRGLDPVVMTACAMTGGALSILPIALGSEGVPLVPTWHLASAFAVIGFGLTSAAFLIMYSILPRVGATNLSLVTLIAPVSATLIGVSFFGETLGAGQVIGMALILSGLIAIDGRVWSAVAPYASGRSA